MPSLDQLITDGLHDLAHDVRSDPEVRLREVHRSGRRHRRRRTAGWATAVAVSVVAFVVLAGILWRRPVGLDTITNGPASAPGAPGTTSMTATKDPADEGYIDSDKRSRYKGWIDDYDPAEVARLRQPWPDLPDDQLVTTLEFREACRVAATTWDRARTLPAADVDRVAHELMDPEIARLAARKTSAKSQEDLFFVDLRDRMVAGTTSYVDQSLEKNCGEALSVRREPWRRGG